jgi:hypothetical protein
MGGIFSCLREVINFTKKWKDYKRTKKFMKKYMKNENWCYATILNGFKLWHVDSDLYQVRECVHCKENPIYVFLFWELRGFNPSIFPHSCVCERFTYSQDWPTYCPAAEYADQTWKYINLSQKYECRNWETEHYNSVLEITVSFLGIHKWEPDIYSGF